MSYENEAGESSEYVDSLVTKIFDLCGYRDRKESDRVRKEIKKIEKKYGRTLDLREDGRVEYTCGHGIGHTVWVPPEYRKLKGWWSHGCDGCCKD